MQLVADIQNDRANEMLSKMLQIKNSIVHAMKLINDSLESFACNRDIIFFLHKAIYIINFN